VKNHLTEKDKNILITFTLIIAFSIISIMIYSISMIDDRRYLSLQSKANNEMIAKNYDDAIVTFTEMLEYDRDKEIINKNIEELKALRKIEVNNINVNGGERSVKCAVDARYVKDVVVIEKPSKVEKKEDDNNEKSYSSFKDKLQDGINSLKEGYDNLINGLLGRN